MITKFKKYSTGPVDVFDVNGKLLVSLSPECSISILPDDFFVFKNGGVEVFKTEWAGIKDYTTDTLLGNVAVDVMSALRNTYFFKSAVASSVSADNVSTGSTNQITTKDQITTIGIHGLTEKTPPLSTLDEIGIWDNVTSTNKKATLDTFKTVILSWLGTVMKYQGNWNASNNTPTLINNDVTKASYIYRVSVAGTQFSINWKVGDWLVYNASGAIEIADNSDVTRADLGLATTDTVIFANLSGNNTGDQDLSGLIPKLGSSTVGAIPFFTTTDGKTFGQSTNATLDANGTLNLGGSTGTFGFNQKGTAASDAPTIGSELLSIISGWSIGSGWSGDNSIGFTHTSGGGTSVLSNSANINGGIRYWITISISGITTGSISISIGGNILTGVASSVSYGINASTSANLTITPTTDFNGSVIASVKTITAVSSIYTSYTSSGILSNENRNSNAGLFWGLNTGRYIYSGSGNVSILGMQSAISSVNSTAIGANSMFQAITLTECTSIGSNSMFTTKSATNVSVYGAFALYSADGISFIDSFGSSSLRSMTSGQFVSAFGNSAGRNLTNGAGGVFIGYQACAKLANGTTNATINTNGVYCGNSTRASADSVTNENVFGYLGIGIGSNTVMLGNSSIVITATYGKFGAGIINPTAYVHMKAGTTAAGTAPLKFTSQSAGLTTVEAGAMELIGNSLQFTQLLKRRGVAMSQGVLIADVSVNNTSTESAALITASHSTGYLEVGKCEEISIRGTISQRSGASANGSFRIKYAGTTIQTISTPANTLIAAGSPFELRVSTTVRSIGASGTMHIHGILLISGVSIADFGVVSTATIDTTTAQNTTVTFQWNETNAADLMTVNQGRVLCIEPDK